ncbi:phosphotyrosine interaction domain protein [Opisthorchis viverrini]|uniref:Phosphotyrosine interaction domain protein n=1 Tax=Opisthorchis viverrini TaxID=6198 RepID=A0A1S8X956_OPIVI|nr:phosphotyrosine interaction domain protein [Opisthorchis viverrini]
MTESPNLMAPETLPEQSIYCFTGANAQLTYYGANFRNFFPLDSTWSMSGGSRWLYSDDQLAPDVGVQFELRYVGSIPVLVSIKSVDLETRTKIAHAAINRVCEDVGLKLSSTRLSDKLMSSYLGTDSNKQWAMTSVCLTITSQHLTVESLRQPKQQLFRHNLSMVSFASAGDSNSLDLFCYVAKDVAGERLCHTFDCPGGIAQEVITTLGQAFQLGFQDFQRTKSGDKAVPTLTNPSVPLDSNNVSSLITFGTAPTDPFQSRAPSTKYLRQQMVRSVLRGNCVVCYHDGEEN